MTGTTASHESDALDKLAVTRGEVRDILQPDHEARSNGQFPRSATMRALTGGGAVSALALVGIAILATRPSVAGRIARAVPLVDLLRQLRLGTR
jgi:hypothetical protein